jgi:hypothetical protein
VQLAGFCARIHFVAVRQRIRPQTARAHSLSRYVQLQKNKKDSSAILNFIDVIRN